MSVGETWVMMCVYPYHIGWLRLVEVIQIYISLIDQEDATQNAYHGGLTKNVF